MTTDKMSDTTRKNDVWSYKKAPISKNSIADKMRYSGDMISRNLHEHEIRVPGHLHTTQTQETQANMARMGCQTVHTAIHHQQ